MADQFTQGQTGNLVHGIVGRDPSERESLRDSETIEAIMRLGGFGTTHGRFVPPIAQPPVGGEAFPRRFAGVPEEVQTVETAGGPGFQPVELTGLEGGGRFFQTEPAGEGFAGAFTNVPVAATREMPIQDIDPTTGFGRGGMFRISPEGESFVPETTTPTAAPTPEQPGVTIEKIRELARQFGGTSADVEEIAKLYGIDTRGGALPKTLQEVAARQVARGEKTLPEAAEELTAGKSTSGQAPASLRIFEGATTFTEDQRGTPEYEKGFQKFRSDTFGKGQVQGKNANGDLVIFNPISKTLETKEVGTLISKTKKTLPAETVKQLATFDSIAQQIGNLRKIAKEDPDKFGPIQGRWNKLKAQFVEDKDFTSLARNTSSLIQIAYALSGKQISFQEMQMLQEAILPAVTQPDANFLTAIDFAEEWVGRQQDNQIAAFDKADFFVEKFKGESKKKEGKPKSKFNIISVE
jgi:hypothetical protein